MTKLAKDKMFGKKLQLDKHKLEFGDLRNQIWLQIQVASQMFGVFITSLQNHLSGIIQSRRKGNLGVLQKREEWVLVLYVIMMYVSEH